MIALDATDLAVRARALALVTRCKLPLQIPDAMLCCVLGNKKAALNERPGEWVGFWFSTDQIRLALAAVFRCPQAKRQIGTALNLCFARSLVKQTGGRGMQVASGVYIASRGAKRLLGYVFCL